MKYSLILALIAIISFSACKKNYTCECTTIGSRYQFDVKKASRKAAKKECESHTNKPELDGPMCFLK